jgi:serine/threonine-protein kinase
VAAGAPQPARPPAAAPVPATPKETAKEPAKDTAKEPAKDTVKPKTPAEPAGGCDPPYTVDANGIKRYKPQCLQ